jgi:phospholipase C
MTPNALQTWRLCIVLVTGTFLTFAPHAHAQLGGSPGCAFVAGALPADTLPAGTPHGAQIPIDHIVVMMQENRSFDHYFGELHRFGQPKAQGFPKKAKNPDPTTPGHFIKPFHQKALCEVADLDHSWSGTHAEVDGGKMDGFATLNVDPKNTNGSRAMGFYTAGDLNFYYALYRTFAMGDQYFCSLEGPTFPNRFYLLAGTSFGHIQNDFFSGADQFAQPTIFNLLDAAGITWKIYQSQLAFAELFAYVRNHLDHVVPVDQFSTDAAAGTLPQVAFVDPIFVGTVNVENDEHPPANVQVGQAFVGKVITAFMASPLWPHSALFLTYDEHGGYYDHVPPPAACVPDGIKPMLGAGDVDAAFDHYGVRVPAVVVSPYARKHFVSHTVHDHTSILRFIETRFDLPALTRRDANADPMLEFFDFSKPSFSKPPKLPEPRVSASKKARCAAAAGTPSGEL